MRLMRRCEQELLSSGVSSQGLLCRILVVCGKASHSFQNVFLMLTLAVTNIVKLLCSTPYSLSKVRLLAMRLSGQRGPFQRDIFACPSYDIHFAELHPYQKQPHPKNFRLGFARPQIRSPVAQIQNFLCVPIFFCECHEAFRLPIDSVSVSIFLGDHVAAYRLSPSHGVRFGEADLPGPSQTISLTCTLANPTAVHGKADILLAMQSDLICLSETSATKAVQISTQRYLRTKGYASHWSAAAEPHQDLVQLREAVRGKAVGTSIHTTYPMRPVRLPHDITAETASRITAASVQFGELRILVIVLYGYVNSQPQAKKRTSDLLRTAIQISDSMSLPCMIFGDINHDVETLSPWRYLSSQGFRSAKMLYQEVNKVPMPCTYQDSSCNDQALFSPLLCPLIRNLRVRPPGDFSGHKPVQFELCIPADLPKKIRWRQPKPLHIFHPDTCVLAEHYLHSKPDFATHALGSDDLFHVWSQCVEQAFDSTLHHMHRQDPTSQPFDRLPAGHTGRCHHKPQKAQAWPSVLPTTWHGQYDSYQNTVSHGLRAKIKQLRRIQSLVYRLRKLALAPMAATPSRMHDLRLEWQAILKAPGFNPTFAQWIVATPELQYVPCEVPTLDYMLLLEQFLKLEVEAQDAQEAKLFRKSLKYQKWFDKKHGHLKQAFRQVRDSGLPPVTYYVTRTHQADVAVRQTLHGLWTLQAEQPLPLAIGQRCKFATHDVEICDVALGHVTVMPIDDPEVTVLQGALTWEDTELRPHSIASELETFWNGFWKRDSESELNDPEQWQAFAALLKKLPPLPACVVDDLNLDDWVRAIKHTKSASSAGICGWAPDDLKCLPDCCVQDLAVICHRYRTTHFPVWMLQARTVPFRKHAEQATPAMTRPITIMSLLYRIWGRVLTQQVAKHWSVHMSEAVIGFLPGRSAARAAWDLQWRLEQIAHIPNVPGLGGLTLDLIKAFNTLPRLPCRMAMIHAGISPDLALHWQCNMSQVQRHWQIQGSVIPSTYSSTGAPEGDSWSVLAMLAVGHCWAQHLSDLVQPSVYADNLGWSSHCPPMHAPAHDRSLHFMSVLKLQVDWSKTFMWGSHAPHRQAWQHLGSTPASHLAVVPILSSAADLGYQMHFRLCHDRTVPKKRHQAATAMLERLLHASDDLDNTARIIKCAVWPRACTLLV